MTNPDLARWNARFSAPEPVFGEAPNSFLARQALGLPPGRALCVADGQGRNGVWLAEQGWDVLSLDFSDVAQQGARDLAARRGVSITLEQADVHDWSYPPAAFDLVADIFSQFSPPDQRARKWTGMLRSLRPGGVLILEGYTPRQLVHGTGGPRLPENLYTESLLRAAFGALDILLIDDREEVLDEGSGHSGLSAVIGLAARKRA